VRHLVTNRQLLLTIYRC